MPDRRGEEIEGLRSSGLFATEALRGGIARTEERRIAGERALAAGRSGGRALLAALGFTVETPAGPTALLTSGDARLAVAVLLERGERVDVGSRRFGGVSPVLHGLARADAERVGFVLVLGDGVIRLYAVVPGFGVARRGRTDTFVEIALARLREAEYLAALFSAEALQRDGRLCELRALSRRHADAVALRLRARIVEVVVPGLARAILAGRSLDAPTPGQLEEVYEASLRVLFARLFAGRAAAVDPIGGAVADEGEDARSGPIREALAELADVAWEALTAEALGTIHEGLLACRLALAAGDLAVRERRRRGRCERYHMSARPGECVAVAAGRPYLRADSGERKFLGSFYSGRLVIDHVLDHGLERALGEHVERLAALDDEAAARGFFDVHVADLAMGAGHFLIAAVDRTERALGNALVARPLPGVLRELAGLRSRARERLGAEAGRAELDDGRLLRWLLVQRCIHGVDSDPGAVALARRALQQHAFVPGLPAAAVACELVVGDSLVGLGTLEEALAWIDGAGGERSGLYEQLRGMLAQAGETREAARPVAALFDILTASRVAPELAGTIAAAVQVFRAEPGRLCGGEAHARALAALAPLRPLHMPLAFPAVFGRAARPGFDAIVGNPPWEEATLERDDFWSRWSPGLQSLPQHRRESLIDELRSAHPEREGDYRQEVARAAGLRRALSCGDYPGMTTGDPDLYKAFAWRLWRLVAREGGRLAIVLPRSALAAKGSAAWRAELAARGRFEDVTLLVNRGGWVFEDVHPQYTVALVCAVSGRVGCDVPLRGPFAGESAYRAGMAAAPAAIPLAELRAASEGLALPLLPTPGSIEIWLQIRRAPRLDCERAGEWRARPVAELHATQEKVDPATGEALMHFVERRPEGFWPVYKGESFDIWRPDRGRCYAWAEPRGVTDYLQGKRLRAAQRGSPFAAMGADWRSRRETLPCLGPRVAFRDVTRATDSRTIRAALVPAEVVLTNTAPYLLWPRGDATDQAFVLGVLCSLPLDWYARRYVETHLNFHVFNALPIPRPGAGDPLRARVVALAGRLAAQDLRFAGWAREVGVACGELPGDEEEELAAELDAVVAHLYGLSRRQLEHVLATFHDGWDGARRREAALRHFERRERRAVIV